MLILTIAICSSVIYNANSQALITIFSHSWQTSTQEMTIIDEHPSDSAYNSAIGNAFIAQNSAYLAYVNIEFVKNNGPTSTVYCQVYDVTGSISSHTAYPGSTLYASSVNTLSSSSFTASVVTYSFLFNQSFYMEKDHEYAIMVYAGSENVDTSSYFYTRGSQANVITNATMFMYRNGAYTNVYVGAINLAVFGVSTSSQPTPTPSTSATVNPQVQAVNDFTADFTSYLIPILALLIPSVLMGFVFRMGKWGYLIGITIGAALGFLFMPASVPIWIVVGVLIGVIGLVYQSTRNGGDAT